MLIPEKFKTKKIETGGRTALYKKNRIMKNTYKPSPVETDSIELPAELLALAEDIARNVHEVWAQSRISQGWTFGPERDDNRKEHPCLIPYEELPEIEKAYDRDTALGTLKLIRKLGFKITKE